MSIRAARDVKVGAGDRHVLIGNDRPLSLIAGPCALEDRDMALAVADELARLADRLRIGVIFKASYDKANRTSRASPRGVGLASALPIFRDIKAATGLPITTDVHERSDCAVVAEAVDLLQIPAFLCRQTDLIVAAAATGRPINIKKGPFMAPEDMRHAIDKANAAGDGGVLVTERGASFGYHALVADMRALPILAETGAPVVFDATHAVQAPGANIMESGGDRRFVAALARAAVAVGVAGLFIETHPAPENAISDRHTQWPLDRLETLLEDTLAFDRLRKTGLKS